MRLYEESIYLFHITNASLSWWQQLWHNVYRKLRVSPITEVYWMLLRTSSLVVGGDSQVVENLRRQLCAPRHHSAQTRVWWEHIGRPDEEVQAPGGRGEREERRRNSYETGGSLKLMLLFKKHWLHLLKCNVNWCTLHTHAKIILTLSCVQTLWPTKSVSCYISCFYFSLGVLCIRQLFLLHFEMFPIALHSSRGYKIEDSKFNSQMFNTNIWLLQESTKWQVPPYRQKIKQPLISIWSININIIS